MKPLILLTLIFTASAAAQMDTDNFSKIIGSQPTVEINLGKAMLGLLSSATNEEEGIASVLSALSAINVTVYELGNDNNIKSIRKEINSLAKSKEKSGFEKLATIREEDSLVYVYANSNDGKLNNLSIIALDDEDELVLIEIEGSMLLTQIGELMEHFDVDIDINGLNLNN